MARILIVDDEQADRMLLQAILDRHGHTTLLAGDGQEALELHGGQAVDIVVTDLQMPNMHGLEFISLLRDLTPRPAIIAISGTGEPQLDVASALGADQVLSKPISEEGLLSSIRAVSRTRA